MCIARWALTVLLTAASPALADRIELANGDSLEGEIVAEDEERIVFEHPLLGRLEIPREHFTAAPAESSELVASDEPAESAESTEPIEPAESAELVASDEPAESAESAEPVAPAESAESVGEASQPERPGLFGTRFLAGWKRNLSIGMSGSEGKSKEASFNSKLLASYDDDRSRWKFDSGYFFSSSDGEAETNEVYVQLNKDWLLADSRWFFFAEGRYDYDEFRDWDHRTAGTVGVGYQFVKRERWDLLGRVGGGANRTIGGEEALTPEARTGFETVWRIADGLTLSATTFFLPDLSELGEFRTLSTLDWVIALSERYGLSFKLSLSNEYESLAEDEKNDFRYVGSLGYDF